MPTRAVRWCLLLSGVVALPGAAQSPKLGTLSFPTSAGPAAHAEFVTGMLWLHSFEYQRAADAFRRAQELQPGFALAYWGEAMTLTHPVWNQQDLAGARAVLKRLGPDRAARAAKAETPRERGYLEAVEILYGEGSKPRRDTLYAEAMARLVTAHPEDHEAKALYALALLGLSQGVRDTATYLRAAPYADTVFRANPDHPGAAHYLIHAFDDPFHASRGLEAARAYSRIAPDAPHAQHMTTHIFLALGMWPEVVTQNRIAVRLTREVPGHYSSWLHYGLLQQGRVAEASDYLIRLGGSLDSAAGMPAQTYRATMRAHQVLHTDGTSREGPMAWQLPVQRLSPIGQVVDAYVRGVVAYRRRHAGALSAAGADAAGLSRRLDAESGPGSVDAMQARVMARELGALLLFLNGARDQAVRVLREAADIEDAIPLEFGPPIIVEPSHELLGQLLLEMDPRAAQHAFERALALAPGRARSLEGLVRASVAAGDRLGARKALTDLAVAWRGAEPSTFDRLERLRRIVSRM